MKTLLTLGMLILSLSSYAETEVGNGGAAWTCRSRSGALQEVRLLDIFEAENEHGYYLQPAQAFATLDQWLEFALENANRMHPLWTKGAWYFVDALKHKIKMAIRNNQGGLIARTYDYQTRIQPDRSFCRNGIVSSSPEQVASFFPSQTSASVYSGSLLVNRDLLRFISRRRTRELAALVLHEGICAYMRTYDEASLGSTKRCRQVVSALLSDYASGLQNLFNRNGRPYTGRYNIVDGNENSICRISIEYDRDNNQQNGLNEVPAIYFDPECRSILPHLYYTFPINMGRMAARVRLSPTFDSHPNITYRFNNWPEYPQGMFPHKIEFATNFNHSNIDGSYAGIINVWKQNGVSIYKIKYIQQ